MKKLAIYFDSDGFFWPSDISSEYMSEERNMISFDDEKQSGDSLFEQYYLGFRSAMYICEDKIETEEEFLKALEALKKYREGCIGSAWQYVENHIGGKPALPVDFMWITKMKIMSILKDDYPEIDKIHLRLSMKPRIAARTNGKNTIIFPALTRTLTNHCNLVLINSSFQAIDEGMHSLEESNYIYTARFILPYLLFCHDDFSVKNLPIIGAYSGEAIMTAIHYTNLQTMFIIAHEYAHILLRHYENDVANSGSNDKIENEADSFALKVILNYIKVDNTYSTQDVFTAIRWLFKYQLIEESIGVLIQGGKIDSFQSTYEERRSEFQAQLFDYYDLKGCSQLDVLGFAQLCELQNILYEFGSNLINDIINSFHKSDKIGGINPWWEKILKN